MGTDWHGAPRCAAGGGRGGGGCNIPKSPGAINPPWASYNRSRKALAFACVSGVNVRRPALIDGRAELDGLAETEDAAG